MSRERQRDREPRDMERDMEKEGQQPGREGGQGGGQQGGRNRPNPEWEEETRGTADREPGGEEGDLGSTMDEESDEGMDADRDIPR